MMDTITKFSIFFSILTFVFSILAKSSYSLSPLENFVQCISNNSSPSNPASSAIYTPNNSSFLSILHMHTHNNRFSSPKAPKPLAIVTSLHYSHVQGTILCAQKYGIQIRIRSGGHDTEGLSYVSDVPFIILDMFHHDSVDVDIENGTTWVESGATIGKVYYEISKKSKVHAFPSGVCPTVATGGHYSGGGYGNLMRKFGLSVDNIIDAKIVDVNGNILDRNSMGEDLFWAIRGGGGASFGVILKWKIKLVSMTPKVTVFSVQKSLENDANVTNVVYKWQKIAPKLDENVFIRAKIDVVNGTQKDKKTINVTFVGMFLGQVDNLLTLITENFIELGLKESDCIEMSWVNSTLYWASYPIGTPLETLLDVPKEPLFYNYKTMSDYVKKPISKIGLKSIWDFLIKNEHVRMEWNPYGGKMNEISTSKTPFPHRKGNLFLIEYLTSWGEDGIEAQNHYLNISKSFYEFMTPFVSNSPREAFLNYRDLNIGANNPSNTTKYGSSLSYGIKYFRDNFQRLVSVKSKVDPHNFFVYEQSIPPLLR